MPSTENVAVLRIGEARRLLDLEQAEGRAEFAEVDLGADLVLPRLHRREHLAGVDRAGRRGRPLLQSLDPVGATATRVLPRLHDKAERRREGRSGRRTR